MSSFAVVDELEKRVKAFCDGHAPVIPFYSTINARVAPKDDLWVTCSFYAYDAENVCYGGPGVIESGACDVSVFAKAGKGYAAARQTADEIALYFRQNPGVGLPVVIKRVTPNNEGFEGDARHWYQIQFALEYDYFN